MFDNVKELFKSGSKAEVLRKLAKKQSRIDARREWWKANRPKEDRE